VNVELVDFNEDHSDSIFLIRLISVVISFFNNWRVCEVGAPERIDRFIDAITLSYSIRAS
jgi:hypothetical protein